MSGRERHQPSDDPAPSRRLRRIRARLELSAPPSDPVEAPAAGERPTDGSGRVVLMVDDDERARTPFALGLEMYGYIVLEAASGEDALRLLALVPRVGVVVTDTGMPGMSGNELIRRIRALRPEQPILRISGGCDSESLETPPPGVPFLAKPFRLDDLLQQLAELAPERRM